MDDKTLLERAAKAYGIIGEYVPESRHTHACISFTDEDDCEHGWNPLTDDGEALRLAVRLGLSLHVFHVGPVFAGQTMTSSFDLEIEEDGRDDPYAATRRAIVRAAAALASE